MIKTTHLSDEPKICPRCSNSFVCRQDRTDLCSCTRIYLLSGVRDYVKENYDEFCIRLDDLEMLLEEIEDEYIKESIAKNGGE